MSDWYYASGDQQLGPVSLDNIRAMAASGQLRSDQLVWTDGMSDWQPAGSVPALGTRPADTAAAAVDPYPTTAGPATPAATPYGAPAGYGADPAAYGAYAGTSPGYPQTAYPQPGSAQPGYPTPGPAGYGQPLNYGGYLNYAPPVAARHSGMAIGAFVTSLVGLLCLGIILGPVGLILGIVALNQAKQTGQRRGLAIAAIVIGGIDILLLVAAFVIRSSIR